MGTRRKPCRFDCYAKAEPDEPLFTLLARDPEAAFLVATWSAVRLGDWDKARRLFQDMLDQAGRYTGRPDMEKGLAARDCAAAMELWRRGARCAPVEEARRHG